MRRSGDRQDRRMTTVPLRERKYDLIFLGFFVINASFITYIVDLEQLVIADPNELRLPDLAAARRWSTWCTGTATTSTRC